MKKITLIFIIIVLILLIIFITYSVNTGSTGISLSPSEGNEEIVFLNEPGLNDNLSIQTVLSIIQITPVGLMPPSYNGITEVGIYGSGFDASSKVFLDGIDFSSYITTFTSNKITMMLDAVIIRQVIRVQVVNNGATSNSFNGKETTLRYPEILDLSPAIIKPDDISLTIKGYNFFDTNSDLYLDGSIVDKSDYSLTHGEDGEFTIILRIQSLPVGLGIGAHRLMIDNPSRYPIDSLSRTNSGIIYFYVANEISNDLVFENDKVKLTFDGNIGTLKYIKNKDTNHIDILNNLYPWRVEIRKLLDMQQKTSVRNPLVMDFFNPFQGNCVFSSSIQTLDSVSTLTLSWENCTIDSGNSFSFYENYTIKNDSSDFSFSYRIRPVLINSYGLHAVRLYMGFKDDSSLDNYGLASTYSFDAFLNPGDSIKSKGTTDFCSNLNENWRPCDKINGVADTIDYYYMTDGDGFQIFNFIDIWTAHWDNESNYVMIVPTDNRTFDKYYNHQGYFNTYKSTVVTYIPDDYSTNGFNYDLPYSFKVFVGKSVLYQGKETWIHLADIFREFQQSFGKVMVPFERKGVSDFLMNLDLLWVSDHASEFFIFDSQNRATGFVQNPAISAIAGAYSLAKNFYGASNTFLVLWKGDQDITGLSKIGIRPIPQVTFPLFNLLNQYGVRSCFYALYLTMPENDMVSLNLRSDVQELDPAGTPAIYNDLFYGPLAQMHPASVSSTGSYLSWLVERFRIMNNGQNGARCFYLDGVTSQPPFPMGVWSSKFNSRGFDTDLVRFYTSLQKNIMSAIKSEDSEAFFIHESFLQDSTDDGALSVQGNPIHFDTLGRNGKYAQRDILFLQRVYGGYTDFLISHPNPVTAGPPFVYIENVMVDPLKQMGIIPQNYDYSLTDSFSILGDVGFLYGGGIPLALDGITINSGAGYIPLYDIKNSQNGFPYKTGEWSDALESYANVVKEQVRARQLAKIYFHGLWYPYLETNSLNKDYYYIDDFNKLIEGDSSGIIKRTYPRVLSIVRRAWNESSPSNKYGLLFLNTYNLEQEQNISFNFSFKRYGLEIGQNYNLFMIVPEGKYYLFSVSNDFNYTITIGADKFMLLELEKGEFLGTCGDSLCSIAESCSSCSVDCGPCNTGGNGGGGGGGGSGSGSSGGSPIIVKLQCSDGVDNDGDNLIDYPTDLGCTSKSDNVELDEGQLGINVTNGTGNTGNGGNTFAGKIKSNVKLIVIWMIIIILFSLMSIKLIKYLINRRKLVVSKYFN